MLAPQTFAGLFTFTRSGSVGSYYNSSGVLVQGASADTPRFDYDPVTLAARGLLLEPARTNDVIQSQDASAWTSTNTAVTTNTTAAPDGTTTMDIVKEAAGSGQHMRTVAVPTTTGSVNTGSVFARVLTTDLMESSATMKADFVNSIFRIRNTTSDPWTDVTFSTLFTFTRTSTATYVGSDGLIHTAASGEARVQVYDPTTGDKLGYLSENSVFNRAGFSEDIGNWTLGGSTRSLDTTTAPDGNVTADTLIEDSSTGAHRAFRNSASFTAGRSIAASVWVKRNSGTRNAQIQVTSDSGANGFNAVFDLATLAVSASSALGTGTFTNGTTQQYANGWIRICATGFVAAAATVAEFSLNIASGTSASYAGDGTSSLYLWGFQLEDTSAGPRCASSYIPTPTASVVQRVADNCRALSSPTWLTTTQGTLYARWLNALDRNISGSTTRAAAVGDNATNNDNVLVGRASVSVNATQLSTVGGTTQATFTENNQANFNVYTRAAMAFAANDTYGTANGIVGATDTACTVPTINNLAVGCMSITPSTQNLGSPVQCVMFYPTRLSNTNVESLTNLGVKRYLSLSYPATNFGVAQGAVFDLENGTVVSTTGGGTASITSSVAGTYRCSITTVAATSTGSTTLDVGLSDRSTTVEPTFNGDGVSGLVVWGLQSEIGSLTSYISTTTAAVTRAADTLTLATSEATLQGAGTVIFEGTMRAGMDLATRTLWALDDGTSANTDEATIEPSETGVRAQVLTASVSQASLLNTGVTGLTAFKSGFAFSTNDCSAVLNGGTAQTDATSTLPAGRTTLRLGLGLAGWIRRFRYYRRRLTDAHMQELTR